jgi:DHA1 family bicyclomycin/chloramphenicol resistance-like MFS transporter
MGVSLSFPTITLLMLDRFPRERGAAASVQMALNIGFSAIVAGLAAPLVAHGSVPLALFSAASSACGFLCWIAYRRLQPAGETQGPAADALEVVATGEEL